MPRNAQDFISRNLPKEDFLTLYARVLANFDAYKNQIPDLKQKIEDLKTAYEKTDKSQPANDRYRLKLGYTVLHAATEKGFRTLFRPAQ